MSAYGFPATTEVTTLEGTTISTTIDNGFNAIDGEKPYPASKPRGVVKAIKDVFTWLKDDDEAWINPTLVNSWTNFGSNREARFYKDKWNVVRIQGLVVGGTATAGTVIFTLPVGYRPNKDLIFVTLSNSTLGELRVNSSGTVAIQIGNNVWFNINCMFRAD